jgi:hypothetical protein
MAASGAGAADDSYSSDYTKTIQKSLEPSKDEEDEQKAIKASIVSAEIEEIKRQSEETLRALRSEDKNTENEIETYKMLLKETPRNKDYTKLLNEQIKILKESKQTQTDVIAEANQLIVNLQRKVPAAAARRPLVAARRPSVSEYAKPAAAVRRPSVSEYAKPAAAAAPRRVPIPAPAAAARRVDRPFPTPLKPKFPNPLSYVEPACKKVADKNDSLTHYLLETKGLQRCKANPNGSCMYNSLSLLLHGTEDNAQAYKQIAIWHLANHRGEPGLLEIEKTPPIGKTKATYYASADEYFYKISEPGQWGNELELQAIVEALNEETPGRYLCVTVWSEKQFKERRTSRETSLENQFKLEYGKGEQTLTYKLPGEPETTIHRTCDQHVNLYYNGYHYDALFPIADVL